MKEQGRRKKRPEEHENLERWLVSYADFITLLFAFFTTMYALSSVHEGKYRVMSRSLSEAFNQTTIESTDSSLTGNSPEDLMTAAFKKTFNRDYRKVKAALSRLEEDKKVYLSVEKRGVVVSLSERVIFKSGSADIIPEARGVIDEIAMVLKSMPNYIRIEGHTDNLPINTPEFSSNWELSTARALNILKYLVNVHGLNPGKLSATGYGEFRPIAPNDTPEGRAKNRRVDIVILNSEGAFEEAG